MIYKLNGSKIYVGVGFTHPDGRQFPSNWLNYTKAERDALGITEEAEPEKYDVRFYDRVDGNIVERDLADRKAFYVQQEKEYCSNLLTLTDWYITCKAEKGTAVPDNVATHRDAVRAANVAREGEINGAANITALAALIDSSTSMTQYPNPL